MGKLAGWYRRLRGQGPLAPIGLAIGGMLALALAIAAAVTITGLRFLHFREFQPEPRLSAATLYDLLKIAFAVAAGIGGIVALVTAYRRQRIAEFAQDLARQQHELAGRAEERAARDSQQERDLAATRLLNERFTTAAGQLGAGQPAVRLAGVYAMAGLADDWPQQRQTCVDVLCAYLRMPYEPDPGEDAPPARRQAFQALREVRRTVIGVITAHLQPGGTRSPTAQDWRGLDLDLTGTILDGGSFRGAQFTGGTVSFSGAQFTGETSFGSAEFSGGMVNFGGAQFSGGRVDFGGAQFTRGMVDFGGAQFSGGTVNFGNAQFSGGTVNFWRARFSGGTVYFSAQFSDGKVDFGGAEFSGGTVNFSGAEFYGGKVDFSGAQFSGGTVNFGEAWFSGGKVDFGGAQFSGATVNFSGAQFSGSTVDFIRAQFSGGTVNFGGAQFSRGTVDFRLASDWSVPPRMPSWTAPPPGVLLR
jgi:uncharacterized protein YjbI with pentapeptide repeats